MTPQKVSEIKKQIDDVVAEGLKVDEIARAISRQSIISLATTINLNEINGIEFPDDGITEKEAEELREYNKIGYERLRV